MATKAYLYVCMCASVCCVKGILTEMKKETKVYVQTASEGWWDLWCDITTNFSLT